ncbi:MAG TPA: SUMF1/EgtB/PvdO family nonheme iron enzyme [Caulobacterales bacterium]|nr:SUMF1/EgtB/PvdO family nonheme iron enzyme [Caulobacterales bacterium]
MPDHPQSPQPQPSGQDRQVKLVSIVAIDVVGFSSMSEKDQRNTAKKIEALRGRIDATARHHGGRLFNTAGDGFMLEFGSAGAALEAIQDLLDKRAKGEPKIRVGAHVGDVIVTVNNDLLGHGVNIAARLQALASPGSALVSSEFRSMARTSPSAAFQARGRQPLENIEQKVQTFEILSQKQRFQRWIKRVTYGATGLAAVTALAFVSPYVLHIVQDQLALRTQADASTAAPAPAPQQEEFRQASSSAPATTEAAPAALTAGQSFRDCADCPEMVVAPGGLFTMGSPATEFGRAEDEGPTREVSIAPFAVGKYEVTFAEWDACVTDGGCNGFSPSDRGWGRANRPVVGVSWADAQAFVRWLNLKSGSTQYRLLTEAEWEYAARAGSQTAYAFGDQLTPQQATFHVARTTEEGAHQANAFGLYDLHGNAAEWVEDCYAASYNLAPVDGTAVEADRCRARVYRGGGYSDASAKLRAAARRSAAPDLRQPSVGFRVARTMN